MFRTNRIRHMNLREVSDTIIILSALCDQFDSMTSSTRKDNDTSKNSELDDVRMRICLLREIVDE